MRGPARPSGWVMPRRGLGVPAFVRRLERRHPEFTGYVGWPEFTAICQREGLQVRVVELPDAQRGRLLRVGTHAFIQINRRLPRVDRLLVGMHELCHWFRDDPGVPCYYETADDRTPDEEFADVFAWWCISPARDALVRRGEPPF